MTTAAMPAADVDLFADPVLADPYPAYRMLRHAGPAVYLPGYRVWVLARDREVRHAVGHPEVFAAAPQAGLLGGPTVGEAGGTPTGHGRGGGLAGEGGDPARDVRGEPIGRAVPGCGRGLAAEGGDLARWDAGEPAGGAVPGRRPAGEPAVRRVPGARAWGESLRAIAAHPGLRTVAGVQAFIADQAEHLAEDLVGHGSFDAVAELAHRFPLRTIGTLLGLPAESRPDLLTLAEAALQAHGPLDDHTVRALLDLEPVFALLVAELAAARAPEPAVLPTPTASVTAPAARGGGTIPPGTADLLPGAAVAPPSGDVPDRAEIAHLLRSFALPCVQAVAAGLTGMLWLLATHPEAWQALRADPSLVPAAVAESLRLETPVQLCGRVTTRDVRVGDAVIPAGERVLLLLGSANRDPRRWPDPDRFDLRRDPADHLGPGHGLQPTLASVLATAHLRAILAALVRRAAGLHLDGHPRRRLAVATRAFASLPLYAAPGRAGDTGGAG